MKLRGFSQPLEKLSEKLQMNLKPRNTWCLLFAISDLSECHSQYLWGSPRSRLFDCPSCPLSCAFSSCTISVTIIKWLSPNCAASSHDIHLSDLSSETADPGCCWTQKLRLGWDGVGIGPLAWMAPRRTGRHAQEPHHSSQAGRGGRGIDPKEES